MGTSTLSHHVVVLNPNLNKVKRLNLFIKLVSLWGSRKSIQIFSLAAARTLISTRVSCCLDRHLNIDVA